jgi:hypothetical protein
MKREHLESSQFRFVDSQSVLLIAEFAIHLCLELGELGLLSLKLGVCGSLEGLEHRLSR